MIYQPRRNGDACYMATIAVKIVYLSGGGTDTYIEALVRIRNRKRTVIAANWDVLPKYHHVYDGESFNVN